MGHRHDVFVERELGHFTVHDNGSLTAVCGLCRTAYRIYTELDVDHLLQRIDDWLLHDLHIQDALPFMSPDDRELLLSGVCSRCYDTMFGECPQHYIPDPELPF